MKKILFILLIIPSFLLAQGPPQGPPPPCPWVNNNFPEITHFDGQNSPLIIPVVGHGSTDILDFPVDAILCNFYVAILVYNLGHRQRKFVLLIRKFNCSYNLFGCDISSASCLAINSDLDNLIALFKVGVKPAFS